jgi:AcrR family transcriptional regulator
VSEIAAGSAPQDGRDDGLRARKKVKIRRAIEDAALELFVEQGYDATTLEQIAHRAEVSITTIFRYFPSKAHVLRGDQATQHSLLRAIAARPGPENEFDAVRHAIREHWAAAIDPQRAVLYSRAIATSHVLRGIYYDVTVSSIQEIAGALAERKGLDAPDRRCWLAARVCSSVMSASVDAWVELDGAGDLADLVDETFDGLRELCSDWLGAPRSDVSPTSG